jgi:hypothetical protein
MYVNLIFMAVLQMRDYNLYDNFSTASIVLAHIFVFVAMLIISLLAYKIIKFFNDYPKLS